MKILCLHGAYGSAEKFQVQLGPFIEAIETSSSVAFKWIDGGHTATPPTGFEHYFGQPPLYRFINFDGINAFDDALNKIRTMPAGQTAEDTMRSLMGDQELFAGKSVKVTMDRLFEIIDNDPEITGILGYSEGATTAATLVLEESRRLEEEGRPRRIQFAIFFAGWPPVQIRNGTVKCILADECEDFIDIPTCHVVGCNDPYIHGAMALYSVCAEDTAILFDHGKGHTIPRDARTIEELTSAIKKTCDKGAQEHQQT